MIKLISISKRFGSQTVLDNLDLNIARGEIFGLIGPSGCGKSTLMKIILGIYQPDHGRIIIEKKGDIKRLVGFTTQENAFYYRLTIMENMQYYARLYGVHDNNHIQKLLNDVELWERRDTLAKNISGGMKRRLDFAISLIHDPPILILDEPTTGLDPLLVDQFWNIVKKCNDKTIIVSSHIFFEIEQNCTTVGIMHKGNIKYVGKPKSLHKLFEKYTT